MRQVVFPFLCMLALVQLPVLKAADPGTVFQGGEIQQLQHQIWQLENSIRQAEQTVPPQYVASPQTPAHYGFPNVSQQHAQPATQSPVAGHTQLMSTPNDSASLLQHMQSVEQRLQRLEAENGQLRQYVSGGVTPASWGSGDILGGPNPGCNDIGGTGWACDAAVGCDDGSCSWVEQLSDDCKEALSWNKAGGWRIVPFGRLRGEAIYAGAGTLGDAVIVSLTPGNSDGIDDDTTTIHARQSQINFEITGPNLNGWQTGGLIITNFMGAQPLRTQSTPFVVNAYGEIKNDDWSFRFGRMLDLFGPIAPSTVNQLNQRGAGNIGIFRGAFNIDRYVTVSDSHKWTLSSRISQQDVSDYAAIPVVRGKDNGWPNIEARVGVELGREQDYGRPVVIGVSTLWGETQAVDDQIILDGLILPGVDEVAQTRGVALDWQLQGELIGVRGEAWWGRAAGSYFVAVLQSLNPETDQEIESIGGWFEAYVKCCPDLTMHVGYGVDDPSNNDLGIIDPMVGVGQTSFNDVAWWNMIYDVTDYFALEFEVSHRRTRFLDPIAKNEGTLYHFASTLSF